MSLPFLSLDGATATGPGLAHDLEQVLAYHYMAVTMSDFEGSGTVRVDLEVSLDGETWVSYAATGVTDSGGYSEVGLTGNGTIQSPLNPEDTGSSAPSYPKPARYVRANLTRYDATIAAGSVSAYVASY